MVYLKFPSMLLPTPGAPNVPNSGATIVPTYGPPTLEQHKVFEWYNMGTPIVPESIGPQDPSWDSWHKYGNAYGPPTLAALKLQNFSDWAYEMRLDDTSRELLWELTMHQKLAVKRQFPVIRAEYRNFNAILTTHIKNTWPAVYKKVMSCV